MAAIDVMFRLLRPGDHRLISRAVYGGVYRLTTQFLCQFGMEFSFVDPSDLDLVRQALRANTRMIYVETPTNPSMIGSAIAALAQIANERDLAGTRENTLLCASLQRSSVVLSRITSA